MKTWLPCKIVLLRCFLQVTHQTFLFQDFCVCKDQNGWHTMHRNLHWETEEIFYQGLLCLTQLIRFDFWMCNSLEGSIEGLVFGADLIRFKGVNVKRQKIKTKKINLIAYEWRFCGVIWNVSKEKRAGSKIILCLYSLVKILHSLYGSTQLASSMRTNIMKCFVSSSADFFP